MVTDLLRILKKCLMDRAFLVLLGDEVVADVEEVAHGNEVRLEFAVIISDNQAAQAHFEEEGFCDELRKDSRLGEVFTDDKASEVAHCSKNVCGFVWMEFGTFDMARFPDLNMQNAEGGANGP